MVCPLPGGPDGNGDCSTNAERGTASSGTCTCCWWEGKTSHESQHLLHSMELHTGKNKSASLAGGRAIGRRLRVSDRDCDRYTTPQPLSKIRESFVERLSVHSSAPSLIKVECCIRNRKLRMLLEKTQETSDSNVGSRPWYAGCPPLRASRSGCRSWASYCRSNCPGSGSSGYRRRFRSAAPPCASAALSRPSACAPPGSDAKAVGFKLKRCPLI